LAMNPIVGVGFLINLSSQDDSLHRQKDAVY
jgi:hypothetical protein